MQNWPLLRWSFFGGCRWIFFRVFVGQGENNFSRARQAHLLARHFLNRFWIGLQRFDLQFQLLVVFLELLDLLLKRVKVLALAPQGQITMLAEYFVYDEGDA